MTTGVVLSVDTERYGGTLTVPTAATDLVLKVDDIVDFADEDDFAAGPQWLTVEGSAPMQYVSVDDDNDTVTLAAAVGAVYEAGAPVRMWDGGAEVVSHIAWVELDEADPDDAPVPAEVRHDRMIFFGIDNMAGLVGARVVLEPDEDDPEVWHVAQVIGRQTVVDPDYVATPFFRAYLGANKTIPNNTDTILDGWVVTDNTGFVNPTPGYRTIYREGLYLIAGGQRWATAPTNRKAAGPSVLRANGTTETLWRDGRPNTGAVEESTAFAVPIRLYPGDQVCAVAWQNTGANLDVLGASGARLDMSFFSITWQGS